MSQQIYHFLPPNYSSFGEQRMTCNEVQSLITAAVDGELDEATMRDFLMAIDHCEHCREAYEAELQTKKLLREKLKKVKAPQSLIDAITRQTINQAKSNQQQMTTTNFPSVGSVDSQKIKSVSWKSVLLEALYINPNLQSKTHPIFATSLALCVLAILIFASFVRQKENVFDESAEVTTASHSNIFEMTSRIFHESCNADVKSKDVTVIANQIAKVYGSPIVVPSVKAFHPNSMRVAALGNANVSEIRFVHDVDPKTEVAVYIAKESDVIKNANIDHDVMEYISTNGRNFYQKVCPSGSQVVVWKWGETIYTATTNNQNINLLQTISNPHWVN